MCRYHSEDLLLQLFVHSIWLLSNDIFKTQGHALCKLFNVYETILMYAVSNRSLLRIKFYHLSWPASAFSQILKTEDKMKQKYIRKLLTNNQICLFRLQYEHFVSKRWYKKSVMLLYLYIQLDFCLVLYKYKDLKTQKHTKTRLKRRFVFWFNIRTRRN